MMSKQIRYIGGVAAALLMLAACGNSPSFGRTAEYYLAHPTDLLIALTECNNNAAVAANCEEVRDAAAAQYSMDPLKELAKIRKNGRPKVNDEPPKQTSKRAAQTGQTLSF